MGDKKEVTSNIFKPRNHARNWLELPDVDFLAFCEVDTYRAGGPGGQKRNKTSSAVRLRHTPTGLIVTATESRSQHVNRARAIRRLREMIALTQRTPVPPDATPPAWVADLLCRGPGLRVNRRDEQYFRLVQYILDLFEAHRASTSDAADHLHLTTAQFVRFLRQDPKLWAHANRLRTKHHLHPLI